MLRQATHAWRAITQNLEALGIVPNSEMTKNLKLAVKRDLQAQRLRPNVPVPPRRAILSYLKTIRAETGSWSQALLSLFHSGSWTSSGGSFRLANVMGADVFELCDSILERKQKLRFLEVGAGWAGFAHIENQKPDGIAALAQRYSGKLAVDVELHFTNLTRWHSSSDLPAGVIEHPFVTAAGLTTLERQGIEPNSVDVIYSQAAAYFEVDQISFVAAAARLLRANGVLIYNLRKEDADTVRCIAEESGMCVEHRHPMGGMNGEVIFLRKLALVAAFPPKETQCRPTDATWQTAAE